MTRLILDLRTNYVFGRDFNSAEIHIWRTDDPRINQMSFKTFRTGDDFTRGVRLAEFSRLKRDRQHDVLIFLLDDRGHRVDMRKMTINRMEGRNYGITVDVNR